jgi:hypothetical protein
MAPRDLLVFLEFDNCILDSIRNLIFMAIPKVAPKKRRSGPEIASFTEPEPSNRW